MGQFVRDYPRTRHGGLPQGSQASTSRLHNLQLGVVNKMVEVVLTQVEVVLLLVEVVVVEVHNLMEVVLTAMLFQVGKRLRLQMLLLQVLIWFVIDQLLYYSI